MATYEGPCRIDCSLKCKVPEGVTLTEVPEPRHNWSDVVRCPNEGNDMPGHDCRKVFLVSRA
jgi:hypothetical protein